MGQRLHACHRSARASTQGLKVARIGAPWRCLPQAPPEKAGRAQRCPEKASVSAEIGWPLRWTRGEGPLLGPKHGGRGDGRGGDRMVETEGKCPEQHEGNQIRTKLSPDVPENKTPPAAQRKVGSQTAGPGAPTTLPGDAGFAGSCCPPLMDLNTTQEFLQLHQPPKGMLPGTGKGRDRDRGETALGEPRKGGLIQAQRHLQAGHTLTVVSFFE